MNHTCAGNFYPTASLAHNTSAAFTNQASNIDLSTGFCKRKERRPKTKFNIFSIHLFRKVKQGLFQISEAYISVDIQTFYLMKEAMGTCRDRFISINTSRHDRTKRRLLS